MAEFLGGFITGLVLAAAWASVERRGKRREDYWQGWIDAVGRMAEQTGPKHETNPEPRTKAPRVQ